MKNKYLAIVIVVLAVVFTDSENTSGQPYFDVGGITTWYMPENNSLIPHSEKYSIIFLSVPIDINKRSKFIVSPFFEHRIIKSKSISKSYSFNSISIPVTFLHYFGDSTWSFTVTALPRTNGNAAEINGTALQYGGVFINTYKFNEHFKVKFGLYYNREYFGDFFIPLAGVDWKINKRINLFGVLPGSMKLEYQFGKHIYSGMVFKSITNTYRFSETSGYFKLQDNHIGIFTDFYIPKNFVVVTEFGYTAFRNAKSRSAVLLGDLKGDGFLFKLGLAYRIRFDESD